MIEVIHIDGISPFFLWAIPTVLGLGAIYWLFFVEGVLRVRHGVIMDSRHNEIVGAKVLPRGQIQIIISGHNENGPNIERAEIYGSDLTVWVRNDSDRLIGDISNCIRLTWKAIAPDGTVIGSDSVFVSFDVSISPMQVTEHQMSINADRRMARLELFVTVNR